MAKLIYLVLTQGWDYVEQGITNYQERVRKHEVKALQKLAKRLDYLVLPKALATNI